MSEDESMLDPRLMMDALEYRRTLDEALKQMMLRISPLLEDIARAQREEQEAREMIAAAWPIESESVPSIPRVPYPIARFVEFGAAIPCTNPTHVDPHATGPDCDDARRITREIVRREDYRLAWMIDVAYARYFAPAIPNGLPFSGDDRPDIRRGRIRP